MPPVDLKFHHQTSPHPCVDDPNGKAKGCGAGPGQPCFIRENRYRPGNVGQPRATLHSHRRRGPLTPPPEMIQEFERLKTEVAAAERDERERGVVRQPAPVANDHPPIVPQVIADLEARMAHGVKTYGVPLQPFNGRDALRDAYEEALDLAVYLRQAIEERDSVARQEMSTLHAEREHLRTS